MDREAILKTCERYTRNYDLYFWRCSSRADSQGLRRQTHCIFMDIKL